MKINLKLKDDQYEYTYIDHTRHIARAVLINDKNEVCLLKLVGDDDFGHRDYVETPGGGININEHVLDAVIREVKEETGLDVEVGKLIGVYTDCDVVCANGDQVQSICIGYEMTVVGGDLVCDKDETLELKYFPLDDMPELFCKQHEELSRDIKVNKNEL